MMKRKYSIVMILLIIAILVISGVLSYKAYTNHTDKPREEIPGDEVFEEKIAEDIGESYWASEYIEYLLKREIMECDNEGKFNPDEKVTVKDFLTSMLKACNFRLNYEEISEDEIVSVLTENGLIDNDETMLWDYYISKEQIAILLAKADLKIKGNKQSLVSIKVEDLDGFDEVSLSLIYHSISKNFVECAYKKFQPNASMSKAEVSKILYMFITR